MMLFAVFRGLLEFDRPICKAKAMMTTDPLLLRFAEFYFSQRPIVEPILPKCLIAFYLFQFSLIIPRKIIWLS